MLLGVALVLFFFNTPAKYHPFFDFCKICSAYGGPIIYNSVTYRAGYPGGRSPLRITKRATSELHYAPQGKFSPGNFLAQKNPDQHDRQSGEV